MNSLLSHRDILKASLGKYLIQMQNADYMILYGTIYTVVRFFIIIRR